MVEYLPPARPPGDSGELEVLWVEVDPFVVTAGSLLPAVEDGFASVPLGYDKLPEFAVAAGLNPVELGFIKLPKLSVADKKSVPPEIPGPVNEAPEPTVPLAAFEPDRITPFTPVE